MNIKTYEGFFDWFGKMKNGKKEDIEEKAGALSHKVKHFFEKTIFSDFNFVISEITDEYGGYDIEYTFDCDFGHFRLKECQDRFVLDPSNLHFIGTTQEVLIEKIKKYAHIYVNLKGFNDSDEELISTQLHNINNNKMDKKDFVEDVAERIKDMCDLYTFKVNANGYASNLYLIKFVI